MERQNQIDTLGLLWGKEWFSTGVPSLFGRGSCQPSSHPPPSHLLLLYFLAHEQHPYFPSTLPFLPLVYTLAPRLPLPPLTEVCKRTGLVAAPAAAVRTALAAAKGALLLHLPLPPLVCRRPPAQSRGPDVRGQYPGHHLCVSGSAAPGAGRPGSGGLCPRCWIAYLIHHVHVGQQQHQQCGGREEPACKGECGGRGRGAIVRTAETAAAPPFAPPPHWPLAPAHRGCA